MKISEVTEEILAEYARIDEPEEVELKELADMKNVQLHG